MAGGVTAAVLHCTEITGSVPAENQNVVMICVLEMLLDYAEIDLSCNSRRLELSFVAAALHLAKDTTKLPGLYHCIVVVMME